MEPKTPETPEPAAAVTDTDQNNKVQKVPAVFLPRPKRGFTKENPRPGPGRGYKKPRSAVGTDLLQDMDDAYTTDDTGDDRPGVKQARKLLHEDYSKFVAMYARLKGGDGSGPQ